MQDGGEEREMEKGKMRKREGGREREGRGRKVVAGI